MNEAFMDAINRVVGEHISEINTMVPGVVVSYNPDTNRAVVRPSLPKRLADGTDLQPPQIVSVPVKWPGGGGGRMTFPIKAGDPCEIRFSQRGLDNWMGGSAGSSDDPRSFDLNDAVCDPGLAPVGIPGHATDMVWGNDSYSISIGPNGFVFKTPGGTVTIGADGKVKAEQDIIAGTISLQTHKHIGVQSGASNTGTPTS